MAARARAADTHEGEITVNAELIAVGTEILLGDIVNTDAQLISQGLSELGINVFYQTVVGDNPARLRHVIETARDRADIIITTGGLGPTLDDLTKETLATVFGKKMALHQPTLDRLTEFFNKIGREMTKNNEKQAWLPEGCTVFTNLWGTAPGCAFEAYGKHVLMLPGPPRECNPMWKECAMPYLYKLAGGCIVSHNIRVFGLGESSMEHILHDMMEKSKNPTIAPYAKTSECFARVTAKADTTEECEKLLEPVVREIVELLGDDVYGVDVDSLEQVVGDGLRAKRPQARCRGKLHGRPALQAYHGYPRLLGLLSGWRVLLRQRGQDECARRQEGNARHGRRSLRRDRRADGGGRGEGARRGYRRGHHGHRGPGRRHRGQADRSGLYQRVVQRQSSSRARRRFLLRPRPRQNAGSERRRSI